MLWYFSHLKCLKTKICLLSAESLCEKNVGNSEACIFHVGIFQIGFGIYLLTFKQLAEESDEGKGSVGIATINNKHCNQYQIMSLNYC